MKAQDDRQLYMQEIANERTENQIYQIEYKNNDGICKMNNYSMNQ